MEISLLVDSLIQLLELKGTNINEGIIALVLLGGAAIWMVYRHRKNKKEQNKSEVEKKEDADNNSEL
jgi:ABC-type nickel/cobalt efflux system permease component RcnA